MKFTTILAGIIVALLATYATAEVRYTVTDLGFSGGNESQAWGINDAGQVVGIGYVTPSILHGYVWENGTTVDLGTLGGNLSRAISINNSGQIVGYSATDASPYGFKQAFLYENGLMTDLGIGYNYTWGPSINNSGQIVSTSRFGNQTHACLWENGTVTDLGSLGGESYATSINNLGQVVGMSYLDNIHSNLNAFLWENGVMTDLGGWGGQRFPEEINDNGQVVGYTTGGGSSSQAIMWDNGTPINLVNPGGNSWAYGINNIGQVVGKAYATGYNNIQAVLWEDGVWKNLNELIPANSGLELRRARDINNAGQIAATAFSFFSGVDHAVLLTPIPEPSITIIMVGLLALRRRSA